MELRTYEITTEKLKKEDPPLRLVVLADLHDKLFGRGQKQLLDAIESLSGDMILCAGDMLIGREQARMEHALLLFQGLQKLGIPVIAANGNHESRMRRQPAVYGQQYRKYTEQLRAFGVRVLENEAMTLQHGSAALRICGYELPLRYYRKFNRLLYDTSDLEHWFGTPDPAVYHILLAHNPVYFKSYAAWGADLTLSGHLHGGIVRIPGIGGLITPQVKLFPKYTKGLFQENGKYMAVSAGLGEHTVPIRIFNPPELLCVEIKGTG